MSELHVFRAAAPLVGSIRVPGDKSISHRAVLFAAMAEGTSRLRGVLDSADVRSTMGAVAALGAAVRIVDTGESGLDVEVTGWGASGPVAPGVPIDCGNSGTTARLLLGVLAGWPITATLIGDASLSRRPMLRVIEPLRTMGASFESAEGGTLPVTVRGGTLDGISYRTPVASAQVKSAILLAGVRAAGVTTVTEPSLSRDHTERMLPAFGVPVGVDAVSFSSSIAGPSLLTASQMDVPSDPSSAAFFAAAAVLVPGSRIELPHVGTNPTRSGFLSVLERMGATIGRGDASRCGSEPVERVTVAYSSALTGTRVEAEEIPTLIDEVPVLAVVMSTAHGISRMEGLRELTVKESDRLAAIVEGLGRFGATVRAGADWLEVQGGSELRGARIRSLGDHRLAMTWAVAGLAASGETVVEDAEATEVSYPGFARDLSSVGASVRVV